MTTIVDTFTQRLPRPDLFETDKPLGPLTTLKIGGSAAYYYPAKTAEAIQQAQRIARDLGLQFYVVGGCSNLLVADRGFPGLVIRIAVDHLTIAGNRVRVGAGVPMMKLVSTVTKLGLSGIEALGGVPGTFGGALYGNAGSFGQETRNAVQSVTVVRDGSIVTIPVHECEYGYRDSTFKRHKEWVIVSGELELVSADPASLAKRMQECLAARRSHYPPHPSAGSIFKNPPASPDYRGSGDLIERAGLKGTTIGGAMVSHEHANFIVNMGGATAEHVVELISLIKQKVRDQFGVQLQEEIQYVGF